MSFRITGLDPAPFAELWDLDEAALAARLARRVTVTARPGFPDRVGLEDLAVGEPALLVNFEHQPGHSPYESRYAVYVGRGRTAPALYVDAVPPALAVRTLSVRAFSAGDDVVDAVLVEGHDLPSRIEALFADPRVAYLHVHYAKFGCYAARVERVDG